MSSTQTVRREPPIRFSNLTKPMEYWERETQQASPFVAIDTSKGPEELVLPPAGLDQTTGQTNLNQELIYKKISPDANPATITGAVEGPQTLTAQYAGIRFKSDGTNWWVVGTLTP